MNRRQFFTSFGMVLAALKLTKPARPFPDPDVTFSVPMDWQRWEWPTVESNARPHEIGIVSGETIYFTPDTGNRIMLFDGHEWQTRTWREISIPLAEARAQGLIE